MTEYIVSTADPSGYWLSTPESHNPDEWAWMEQADPAAEIRALRAANARLTVECEAWRSGALALDDEMGGCFFYYRLYDTPDAAVDALMREHAADTLTAQAQADGLYDQEEEVTP